MCSSDLCRILATTTPCGIFDLSCKEHERRETEGNEAAKRLYEQFGFAEVAQDEDGIVIERSFQ